MWDEVIAFVLFVAHALFSSAFSAASVLLSFFTAVAEEAVVAILSFNRWSFVDKRRSSKVMVVVVVVVMTKREEGI